MKIGSLIECVNGNFSPDSLQHIPNRPIHGQHYIVRDIFDIQGTTGIHLEEVVNPLTLSKAGFLREPTFKIQRFREIVGLDLAVERLLEESMLVDI